MSENQLDPINQLKEEHSKPWEKKDDKKEKVKEATDNPEEE